LQAAGCALSWCYPVAVLRVGHALPMLGLIGLIEANQSSLQRKITMQERHLCWSPLFFLAPQWPPIFSF